MATFSRQGHHPLRRTILAAAACVAVAAPSWSLAADAYPSKAVTIVVPYAPGGQGDVFARALAQRLTTTLKQAFIVENKPGASGAIGARYVAKAKNDGYTLLLGQTGEIAVNGFVVSNLGYDPVKEFRPVALVGESPLVLVAPAKSKFHGVKELIAYAKANPGAINYASSGTATPGHLAAAALALGTATKMTHVPYKGAGQAMTDVLAEHVDIFMSSAAAAAAHIKGGRLKALAVATPKRIPAMPNVPAIAEDMVPGFNYTLWGGLFAPAGTPDAVVKMLNKEVNALLTDPEFRKRMEDEGVIVRTNTPEEFAKLVKDDAGKYERLVKQTGIKAE
jgi:tripartite-type tricarboxylate transporter receptor subunit TctC